MLLALRAVAMTGKERTRRPLEIGDALRSGDYFSYHVRIDQDAYVYVLQFFADGTATVLFPAQGDERVPAGQDKRVPSDPAAWFQLDEATGTENVYVIAAISPLARSDPELADLVGSVRTSPLEGAGSDASGDAGAPAPPSHAPKRRAATGAIARHVTRVRERAAKLVRVEEEGSVEYRGRSARGIGIVHFPFRHE